jgi:hypothetical protein
MLSPSDDKEPDSNYSIRLMVHIKGGEKPSIWAWIVALIAIILGLIGHLIEKLW